MKKFVGFVAVAAMMSLNLAAKPKFNEEMYLAVFDEGDFEAAQALLKTSKNKKDANLNALDKAMLDIYMDADASANVKKANAGIQKSIAKKKAGEYGKVNYEYLTIDAFNALNLASKGDFDKAYNAALGFVQKNKDLSATNEEISESDGTAGEMSKEEMKKQEQANKWLNLLGIDIEKNASKPEKPVLVGKDLQGNKIYEDSYLDSPFARYMAVVTSASQGDPAGSLEVMANTLKNLGYTGDVSDDLNLEKGKARLHVVSLAGRIAPRRQGELKVDTAYNFPAIAGLLTNNEQEVLGALEAAAVIGVLLPSKKQEEFIENLEFLRSSNISFRYVWPVGPGQNETATADFVVIKNEAGEVVFSGGANLLEDFDMNATKQVALDAYSAYNKSVAAVTSEKISAIAAASVSIVGAKIGIDQIPNETLKKVAQIAFGGTVVAQGIGIRKIDDAQKSDLRQCRVMPRQVSAVDVTLDPGKYTVEVVYSTGTVDTQEIEVKAGQNVVKSACIK